MVSSSAFHLSVTITWIVAGIFVPATVPVIVQLSFG